jgi:hypothetical protein
MRKLLFILVGLISVGYAQTIQYIGAPTTTVISKGNFRSDSLFYLPKRQKLPTDSGAVRYQISDSSVYYWSGFQWLKLGVNIDTSSMLLPYLRKADTTAMLSPYVRGSGTANYLPKFNASRSIVDSKVYESATNLMFNTTTPYFTTSGIGSFDINGSTASVLVLRKADTARGYWSHNGSTMDINNIAAGDIRFYTDAQLRGRFQTDGTFRLNSLTGTGARSVVADANGVLSASSTPTDLIDTTYISTRAWRQKGIDSVSANVALKVNISDTASMLTNYIRHAGNGLTKSGQALSVDTAAIATRARVQKGIDSVATLATAGVTSVATGYGLSGGTITTTGTISADTALLASRLRVGKVVDSLSLVKQNVLTNPVTGTGTTNYVPKFTGTSTIGNSIIYTNDTSVTIGASNNRSNWNGITAVEMGNVGNSVGGLNGDVGTYITANAYYNSDWKYVVSSKQSALYSIEPARHRWLVAPSGNAGDVISFSSGMTLTGASRLLINTQTEGTYQLDVAGNIRSTTGANFATTSGSVGIGTASPENKLQISESINTTYNSGSTLGGGVIMFIQNTSTTDGTDATIRIDATGSGQVAASTISSVYVSSGSSALTFGTRNAGGAIAERGRFNPAGELLLNTTTDAGDYKLQVSGNAYVTGTTVLAATSGSVGVGRSTTGARLDVQGTTSDNNAWALFARNSGGNTTLALRNDGYMALGNGAIDNFHFRPDGSLGLGVSSPSFKLDVQGDIRSTASAYFATTSGEGYFGTTSDAGDFRVQISGNLYTSGIATIGTATPSASAQLEVTSTTRGFLPPRMTTTQRDAISSPAAGLVIYNTTTSKLQVYTTSWTDLH